MVDPQQSAVRHTLSRLAVRFPSGLVIDLIAGKVCPLGSTCMPGMRLVCCPVNRWSVQRMGNVRVILLLSRASLCHVGTHRSKSASSGVASFVISDTASSMAPSRMGIAIKVSHVECTYSGCPCHAMDSDIWAFVSTIIPEKWVISCRSFSCESTFTGEFGER